MKTIGVILALLTINAYPLHLVTDPTPQNAQYCIITFKTIATGSIFKIWSPTKKVSAGVMCDYTFPLTGKYEITATFYTFDKKYSPPESLPSNMVKN